MKLGSLKVKKILKVNLKTWNTALQISLSRGKILGLLTNNLRLQKDVFVLLWVRKQKNYSDALLLSQRDSVVNEVYYKVHMTRILHTARISNVDSVMFVNRMRNAQ